MLTCHSKRHHEKHLPDDTGATERTPHAVLRDDGDQPVRLRELRDVGRQLAPVPCLGQGLLLLVVQVELRLERYGERVSVTRTA